MQDILCDWSGECIWLSLLLVLNWKQGWRDKEEGCWQSRIKSRLTEVELPVLVAAEVEDQKSIIVCDLALVHLYTITLSLWHTFYDPVLGQGFTFFSTFYHLLFLLTPYFFFFFCHQPFTCNSSNLDSPVSLTETKHNPHPYGQLKPHCWSLSFLG